MRYDTIIILNIIIIFAKTENDWKLDLYVPMQGSKFSEKYFALVYENKNM